MIVANDAVDVLRHGWDDAAGIFAPERPEIAELLQARLEMVVSGGILDEAHLLGAISDIPDLATAAGSSSGPALALRLRRTVYEYLLALDAAPAPAAPAPVPPTVAAPTQDAVPAAEEVAAVGHRRTDPGAAVADEATGPADPVGSSWLVEPEPDGEQHVSEADGQAPSWSYEGAESDALWLDGGDHDRQAGDEAEVLPLEEPHAVETPALERPAAHGEAPDGFVAERAGFHIVEETHPTSVPGTGPATPLLMPDFDELDAPDRAAELPAASNGSTPVAEVSTGHVGSGTHDQARANDGIELTAPGQDATVGSAPTAGELDPEHGWRVRHSGDTAVDDSRDVDHDPFLADPHLGEIRQRIQDRLRRKRCDEAAALLQQLAAEPGGRVVAELAMDAGDRCQSIGKSNAALNCFLAASRADPVYELPLSRLADICIDDQDTDLAVSYLERIARLYKFRGDDRALLRVYRRIATIAPYREDILQALLNAQNTGRVDA